MGLLIRSLLIARQRPGGRILVTRAYSSSPSSDVTVKAMVYSSYGKPSEVLRQEEDYQRKKRDESGKNKFIIYIDGTRIRYQP